MKTLTAAIKSDGDFEALPNMILINHLQDRLILMYRSPDVVKYRQEIEKIMLDADMRKPVQHKIFNVKNYI